MSMMTQLLKDSLAAQWLEQNLPTNRRLNPRAMAKPERAILQNQWRLTGDTIKFDRTGHLIDGQHRLRAVIKTGKSIKALVVWGVTPEAFDSIDRNAVRSNGAILGMRGEKNANNLASALRMLFCYRCGAMRELLNVNAVVTPQDLEDLLEQEGGIRESIRVGMQTKDFMPPAAGGFLHYIFSRQSQGEANQFFDKLNTGVMLTKEDILYRLRERLIKMRATGIGFRSHHKEKIVVLGTCINAWNILRTNSRRRSFVYDTRDEFPEAV